MTSTSSQESSQAQNSSSRWQRLSGPVKVGLVAAVLGLVLAIVGIVRGNVPLNLISIFLALLISGGSWGLVAWAIATAARDVDADLEQAELAQEAEEGQGATAAHDG